MSVPEKRASLPIAATSATGQSADSVTAASLLAAQTAGLRYVSDRSQGIRRLRSGRGFRYVGPDGAAVRDEQTLARIRALVIPPAWTEVWICPLPNGHIQATGRDARGRKQYRYHPRWRSVRDGTKYGRMIRFGEILPRIRARVERDLALPGMPREKVLATVVRLLESTLQRIGSDEYARTNDSYGLTTLRNRHVDVEGSTVRLQFRGKGGKLISLGVSDARVARVVRRCQELPGCELFCYIDDDGQIRDVDSGDVNEYLKEISGEDFTAKDFRTWAGTLLAARALSVLDGRTKVAVKRNVVAAVKHVAERLGNTPAVCRKHYVHPAVLNMYAAGGLAAMFGERGQKAAREDDKGMRAEELCLLRLLREAEAADGAPKTSSRPTRRKTKKRK